MQSHGKALWQSGDLEGTQGQAKVRDECIALAVEGLMPSEAKALHKLLDEEKENLRALVQAGGANTDVKATAKAKAEAQEARLDLLASFTTHLASRAP